MTTSKSPLWQLQAQAHEIAKQLKSRERDPKPKDKPEVSFGIAMDDKVLKITMTWQSIRETEFDTLEAFILAQMQEAVPQ